MNRFWKPWLMLAAVALVANNASAQDAQAEKTLAANERAMVGAVATGDVATFKQHVVRDGGSIDATGEFMAAAEFEKMLPVQFKDSTITSWNISDVRIIWADKNTAVVTSKLNIVGTYRGQPIPSPTGMSTVWTQRNGKWVAVFHQESQ